MANKKAPFRAGFLIHDASRLRRTVVDQRLRSHGITRSQWWVLTNLSRGGQEGLVDRLEENELVERVPDAQDRRAKRVLMSRKGKALLAKLEVIAVGINQEIMKDISAEEEAQLISILSKMKHNLKEMDAVPSSNSPRIKR